MEGLNEIITELHAIKEELTRLADLEEQRQHRRKAQREAKAEPKPEPDAGIIAGTLTAAFSDRYEIRRSELYQFEIETAKAEGREPIGRNKFFRMVQAAGFYLKKKNTGFYFLKL